MALDTEQKTKILFHLGYPAKSIIVGSTHYDGILNSRLENLNGDTEDLVDSLLVDLDAVREKLITAQDIVKAKRVGDIELNNGEIMQLRGEYRRLARELGELLDITMRRGGGRNVSVCM